MSEQLDEQLERARADREALIGKTIAGRYVLRALVGHGGMGAVYEAEHLGLGKRVAIKFIDQEFATDERVVARFAREARAMSAIESAHIVTVFDAGTEDGRPYLVMELLRGEDLGQRLRRMRRVPLPESMHIVAQVLKGLAKAHAAGIVHRDLKPDNVFIVKSDLDPLFAKIVDFGVSKIERPRDKTSPLALTGRGTVLGTPFYMCPEQAQAMPDVDARADIYSVGAILFECLTGRPPHTGETYEQIILSICMRDAPDVRAIDPSLPPEIASFVARALSRERADRFASAERMLAALHELAPEEKRRVPLDVGATETLLSPGVLFPAPHRPPSSPRPLVGAETRIAGSSASDPGLASVRAAPVAAPNVRQGSGQSAGHPSRKSSGQSAGQPSRQSSRQSSRQPSDAGASGERATGARTDAALSDAGLSRRKQSLTPIIATAVIATLLGIGVMLGVIALLDRGSSETATPGTSRGAPPPTLSSGSTPASALSAPSPPSDETAPSEPATAPSEPTTAPSETAPKPSSSDVPPTTKAAPSHPPTSKPSPQGPPSGGAKPGPTKPLDISRDLP